MSTNRRFCQTAEMSTKSAEMSTYSAEMSTNGGIPKCRRNNAEMSTNDPRFDLENNFCDLHEWTPTGNFLHEMTLGRKDFSSSQIRNY